MMLKSARSRLGKIYRWARQLAIDVIRSQSFLAKQLRIPLRKTVAAEASKSQNSVELLHLETCQYAHNIPQNTIPGDAYWAMSPTNKPGRFDSGLFQLSDAVIVDSDVIDRFGNLVEDLSTRPTPQEIGRAHV